MKVIIPFWLMRPAAIWLRLVVVPLVLLLPALLFSDSLMTYRLKSDDFEYLANSSTWNETVSHLFRTHNAHLVPAWRILTWLAVLVAGSLSRIQTVLSVFAYLGLIITMLSMAVLVARETGSQFYGLLAMILAGTTSVLWSSATWYSSGQTLWAGFCIVLCLLSLQDWKTTGKVSRLVLAIFFVWIAGAFWTVGHAAGLIGSVYLATDSRRSIRKAAWIPLVAAVVAVALVVLVRDSGEFAPRDRDDSKPVLFFAGFTHTLQAIPERLVAHNLGQEVLTNEAQGIVLTGMLVAAWCWSWIGKAAQRPFPLEVAGIALVLCAYFVEWSFRGYLPYSSLRAIVPWYDSIPHIGAILCLSCWLARAVSGYTPLNVKTSCLRRLDVVGLLILQLGLVQLHQPRVNALLIRGIPTESMKDVETVLLTPEMRLAAARSVALEISRRQKFDLTRLDQARAKAQALGVGRDAIDSVFGRLDTLEIPEVYNAAGLLGLPSVGGSYEADRLRTELGPLLQPSRLPVLSILRDPQGRIQFRLSPQF